MTIAACHISPEGVVLGADSASTITGGPNGDCHLDYAQKVFEVGPPQSHVGLVTWGLGQIGPDSHRLIATEIGFHHSVKPFRSLNDMAQALSADLWSRFTAAYGKEIARFKDLEPKINAGTATELETREYNGILNLSGGYCLAGRASSHGRCEGIEILYGPNLATPQLRTIPAEAPSFWGVPQVMQRLVFGIDASLLANILLSGKWTGTEQELLQLVVKSQMITPRLLPIRAAIDWVHTVIHTTIRGTKFAHWPHWCGGPVEIAVITTDRPFRWVRHKSMDAAIITAEEALR